MYNLHILGTINQSMATLVQLRINKDEKASSGWIHCLYWGWQKHGTYRRHLHRQHTQRITQQAYSKHTEDTKHFITFTILFSIWFSYLLNMQLSIVIDCDVINIKEVWYRHFMAHLHQPCSWACWHDEVSPVLAVQGRMEMAGWNMYSTKQGEDYK